MNAIFFIVVIEKILSLLKNFWNSFLRIDLSAYVLQYSLYDESYQSQ